IYLYTRDSQLGRGEPVEDAAQVISRMCDVIMVRTFEQDIIERFAKNSRVTVINDLTDEYHPCQILADVYTYIEQRGAIRGRTVAWIGDSNNVCNTWLQAAAIFDFKLHISTPPGYEVEPERMNRNAEAFADPMSAARGAHLVTTDVWTSMGFEAENEQRKRAFQDWQVDGAKLAGDLYLPKAAGPHPAIVAIHGGGWQIGGPFGYQYWGPYLASRGYGVFAISYRLSKPGQKTFPEALHDVRAAIQYLK